MTVIAQPQLAVAAFCLPAARRPRRGAAAVADTFSGGGRAAQPALVNGAAGAVRAAGGQPRVVFGSTITRRSQEVSSRLITAMGDLRPTLGGSCRLSQWLLPPLTPDSFLKRFGNHCQRLCNPASCAGPVQLDGDDEEVR